MPTTRIGIPREVKDGEVRAAATPDTVRSLVARGHTVLVGAGAGDRIGFQDAQYRDAGAQIVAGPEEVYECPLVAKVKELQPEEFRWLRPGCIVLGYQQLARDPSLLDAVLEAHITCVAYESVASADGARPLLAPMSTIAGLMSAPIAASLLQHREGLLSGSGVLLPGLEGVPAGKVLVIGCGVAGLAAARAFVGMGCDVTLLGRNSSRLRAVEEQLRTAGTGALRARVCSPAAVASFLRESDVAVGAVSVRGRLSPKLVTRGMLRDMRRGSVLIDIGIDMGGISETSRQTKLSDPVYVEERILHYCVPNIPALVPRTATQALTAATLRFIEVIAERGLSGSLAAAPELREAVLVHDGNVVQPALAEDTGRRFVGLGA